MKLHGHISFVKLTYSPYFQLSLSFFVHASSVFTIHSSLYFYLQEAFALLRVQRDRSKNEKGIQWDIDLRHRLARFVPCKSEFKVCHARKELGMRGSITACVRFRSFSYSRRSWFERYEKSFVLKMHWILNNNILPSEKLYWENYQDRNTS